MVAHERRLIELGIWTPPAQREAEKRAGAVTVAAYTANWIEQRKLGARTKVGYTSTLDRYIKDSLIGDMPLRSLTAAGVRSWFNARPQDKPTARSHSYQLFHAVCATAVVHQLLPSNTTKTSQVRRVVVPPHIRAALAGHLEQHVAKGVDVLLLSPVRGGCHLDGKSFRDSYFINALDSIGRDGKQKPQPTIHDLRHFAGSMTARVANLRETMDRLGHSTVKASLLYQSPVSGRDAEVAEALSKLAEDDA